MAVSLAHKTSTEGATVRRVVAAFDRADDAFFVSCHAGEFWLGRQRESLQDRVSLKAVKDSMYFPVKENEVLVGQKRFGGSHVT